MNTILQKRNLIGMTQVELARLMNVTQSSITKWESSQTVPRAGKLPNLSKILGCTIDELFAD